MTNTDIQLDLEENPSPASEANQFSTPDERERAAAATHARMLSDKAAEQGPIGRVIGSSDSSLNICFILLILGFIAILISCIAMVWTEKAISVFEKLITFELTLAGYVMGKKTSN